MTSAACVTDSVCRCLRPPKVTRRSPAIVAEDGLDVDDRRAVDGLDGPNPQAGSDHAPDGDRMQANWIRPIRRACREHACERAPLVVPRVNPEHVTPGVVQPRDDDEPVTCGDSLERWTERLAHLQPRVGCAFDPLPRCLRARIEPRANHADRSKLGTSVGLCDGFPSGAGTGCPSHACMVSSAGFTQAVLSESYCPPLARNLNCETDCSRACPPRYRARDRTLGR